MRALNCGDVDALLDAFHDDELEVDEQVAVEHHLDGCSACASALDELRDLRAALVASRATVSREEGIGFQAGVLGRLRAEQGASFGVSFQRMFDDMRLVYSGLGATVAAAACVLMMSNMIRFAAHEQPDSLAAMMATLSTPVSTRSAQTPVVVDARLLAGTSAGPIVAAESDAIGEAEFVVSGVVTREGRVTNVELLNVRSGHPVDPDVARLFRPLVGAVSRARYEPASVDGLPVAVNMVWMVPHTTVTATKTADDGKASRSEPKRRITWRAGTSRLTRI